MAFGAILKPALASLAPSRFVYRAGTGATASVALTFDDGPDPSITPRLLDVLEAAGAKAAFFMQGSNVEKHPALVREIHARGHELGNHGWSHRRPADIGAEAYMDEARRTQALLEQHVGARLFPLFRPPYGTMTLRTFLGLAREGFRFIHWSVDSGDSFIREPDGLAAHFGSLAVRAGDILLFHDDQAQTLEAMPAMLRSISGRSLGFAPVRALFRP